MIRTHMAAPSGTGRTTLCGEGDPDDGVVAHKDWESVTCLHCLTRWRDKLHPPGLPEHSSYKDVGGISIKAILEAKLTEPQLEGYYLGCALDYLLRCNFKESGDYKIQDISKAHDYLSWLLEAQATRTNNG